MKEFFDTSVLIAAFWRGHPGHESSLVLFSVAAKAKSACALHTLAEVYAVMTALPLKERILPDQALLFVQEVRDRCSIVTLDESEYFGTLSEAAGQGFSSGRTYDALLLRCASKVRAETIFTWNLKYFQAIEPSLADRIRTP